MKAFLLAAGYGTRLKPLTDRIPKCLVPINGVPLLEWWFRLFAKYNIDEVLINTNYLADQVSAYIKEHNRTGSPVSVREAYEPTLKGSGGTIAANQRFIGNDEDFLICYADNLTNIDLDWLIDRHHQHNGLLTMGLFRTSVPHQCGIAAIDGQNLIIDFTEKPKHPKSDLANTGIYVARRELFDYFPAQENFDIGQDVLPRLIGKMYGYEIHDYLIDIGTPEKYLLAQEEWPLYDNIDRKKED